MDRPGEDRDYQRGGVEFEDLKLIIGERKAREVCREYGGREIPTSPPDPRAKRNERIKKLYFEDGLTQNVIAKRVGLSLRWVNHIICCGD